MEKEADSRAFTLIELMVVVAIIALLIMFLVPNLTSALRYARTVQCANNLHKISQAFAAHRGGGRDVLAVGAWPVILLPLLDNQAEILICPDAAEEDVQAGYVTLEDKGQMTFTSGQISPLGPEQGVFVAKLSQSQFDAARAAGRLSSAGSADNWNPPDYQPDGNPNTYWLCYEDCVGGGDRDFKDMMLKVTHTPGLAEVVFFRGGYTIFGCSLVDNMHGVVRSFPPYNGAMLEVGEPYPFPVGGGSTYGMNMNVAKLDGGTGKILAVDHDEIVVDTDAGAWDASPSFARHGGKINVVHMDGSVKLKSPDDIDPAEPTVGDRDWRP